MTETQGTTEDLAIQLAELKVKELEPYLTDKRREQIRKQIAHLSFELQERVKE